MGARHLLVDVETAREHLWRLLLDWPGLLGEGPRGPAMARVMGACGQLRSALAAGGDPLVLGTPGLQPDLAAATVALTALADVAISQVLGQAPPDWLAATPTATELGHWAAATDTPAARLLRLVARQGWSAVGRSPVLGPAAPVQRRPGGALGRTRGRRLHRRAPLGRRPGGILPLHAPA
jgi:hypothetical protein